MNLDGLIQHCGGISDLVRGENMNSVGQTKLQLRLESSEPKCANCKYWDQVFHPSNEPMPPHCGRCILASPYGSNPGFTTDLSVCSKWEPKD